jgi:phage tail-like protein
VEVHPQSGGDVIHIRAMRTFPDGRPASYFTPDDVVVVRAVIFTETGSAVPPLQPRDRVVLHVPVRSYLRFLPGLYQGGSPTARLDVARADERSIRRWGARDQAELTQVTGASADQFRRFLLFFQHIMTTVTDRIDQIPALTDPLVADPKFLPWIASWVGFELDESLPLHEQRELVRRSIRLHRTRGTKAGVEEMIRVLTSAPVVVREHRKPQPAVVGALTLAGGKTVDDRYLRDEPPAFYLVKPERASTSFFALELESREMFRRRFGERAPAVLRRIAQVVTSEKPSQISFTIEFKGDRPIEPQGAR